MQEVEDSLSTQNGTIGWTYEGINDQIDVFVTGDVLRLMFA